jgi:hypothetical protein
MTSISKPSKPSETHGEAPPPTWRSERWCARNPSYAVNGGLTLANLLGNQLDAESAMMLAEVAKQRGISLCGIRRDQTRAEEN